MRIKYAITLSLILLLSTAHAQNQPIIDSLKTIIEEPKHDTSVCEAYLSWGEQVYLRNPDTALILWQTASDIAERNLAEQPSPKLEKRFLFLSASAFNNMGVICQIKGDIPNALKNFDKSLRMHELQGHQDGQATTLNNMGVIYEKQGDLENGLTYYHKALDIYTEMSKSPDIDIALPGQKGQSLALNNIGIIYRKQGDNDKALASYINGLKILEGIPEVSGQPVDKKGIANSLNNIGVLYHNLGDTKQALEYYLRCITIQEEIKDLKSLGNSFLNIATLHINDGNLNEAYTYGQRSMAISQEQGSPELISNSAKALKQITGKQGNYREALEMYELQIKMTDSIKNEENQKATIRQQTKYEFEKAQLVKEQEEKEKTRVLEEETSRRDNLQYSVILISLLVIGGLLSVIGKFSIPIRVVEGIIFFSFLILFEFLLVLADPYIEGWSGGAPGIKLLFNAGIAALIFPAHAFFENKLKGRLVR